MKLHFIQQNVYRVKVHYGEMKECIKFTHLFIHMYRHVNQKKRCFANISMSMWFIAHSQKIKCIEIYLPLGRHDANGAFFQEIYIIHNEFIADDLNRGAHILHCPHECAIVNSKVPHRKVPAMINLSQTSHPHPPIYTASDIPIVVTCTASPLFPITDASLYLSSANLPSPSPKPPTFRNAKQFARDAQAPDGKASK